MDATRRMLNHEKIYQRNGVPESHLLLETINRYYQQFQEVNNNKTHVTQVYGVIGPHEGNTATDITGLQEKTATNAAPSLLQDTTEPMDTT